MSTATVASPCYIDRLQGGASLPLLRTKTSLYHTAHNHREGRLQVPYRPPCELPAWNKSHAYIETTAQADRIWLVWKSDSLA